MKIGALIKRKKQQQSEAPQTQSASRLRDEPVVPKRRYRLGRTIAVHFDDQQLHLAVVSHKGAARRLLHVRTEQFPGDLVDAQERSDFIGESVDHYIRKFGGFSPTVYLAIDGPDTAARSMLLPDVKSRSMKGAVSFEAKRQIPFPAEQAVFDHRVIRRLGTKEEPRAQVLLFAATQGCVAKHLQPLLDYGIRVDRVYHSQDSIGALLRELPDFNPLETYATVKLHNQKVEVSFYRGSSLRYWHVSRTSIGWPQTPDGRLSSGQAPLVGERIGQEVQLAMDFYSGKFSDNFAGKVLVFGGHVVDSSLLNSLYQSTGLEFVRFPIDDVDSLSNTKAQDEQLLLEALPVIATASANVPLANLLPGHIRNSQRAQQTNRMAVLGHAAAILLLAAGWYNLQHTVSHRETRLARLAEDIREVQTSPAFHELQLITRQNNLDRQYLNLVEKHPTYLSLVLKELSNLTDRRITLDNFYFEPAPGDKNMILQGKVISRDTPPEILLAEFMKNLDASSMFSDR